MKLLLTSSGLSNKTISGALKRILPKHINLTKVAFVPTAANIEEGDKSWMIEDLVNLRKQGYASIDFVDISALNKQSIVSRLKAADVLVFGGGNTFHLMHWVKSRGYKLSCRISSRLKCM